MNTISASQAASGPIVDFVKVTVDREAEPVGWDDAVARFLLDTVRKSAAPPLHCHLQKMATFSAPLQTLLPLPPSVR